MAAAIAASVPAAASAYRTRGRRRAVPIDRRSLRFVSELAAINGDKRQPKRAGIDLHQGLTVELPSDCVVAKTMQMGIVGGCVALRGSDRAKRLLPNLRPPDQDKGKTPVMEPQAMFVNIVRFPKIAQGRDADFRQWFQDSNNAYANHPGFIRRILLRPREGGNYVAVVEHESYETFMAMHTSPTQAELRQRAQPLFEGNPQPSFYETVLG